MHAEQLTKVEIKTLKEVEIGRTRHLLPGKMLDHLIRWELVEERDGRLVLTEQGKLRLNVETASHRNDMARRWR